MQNDFLLRPLSAKIIDHCYYLFYKVYCKVFERVSLAEIAKVTGKTEDEAELWILSFIRSLDIEAKIDSVERVVISYREEESLNEKYIELIPKVNSLINTLAQALQGNWMFLMTLHLLKPLLPYLISIKISMYLLLIDLMIFLKEKVHFNKLNRKWKRLFLRFNHFTDDSFTTC